MEDIENEGKPVDAATLGYIHENKTAALLTAAADDGPNFGQPSEQISRMRKIGYELGMAFQVIDDILDATSSAEAMGKPVGMMPPPTNPPTSHYTASKAHANRPMPTLKQRSSSANNSVAMPTSSLS